MSGNLSMKLWLTLITLEIPFFPVFQTRLAESFQVKAWMQTLGLATIILRLIPDDFNMSNANYLIHHCY